MMPPLHFADKSQFPQILLKIDINHLETSSESFKKKPFWILLRCPDLKIFISSKVYSIIIVVHVEQSRKMH